MGDHTSSGGEGNCFSAGALQEGSDDSVVKPSWTQLEESLIIHLDGRLPYSNLLCSSIPALPGPAGVSSWLGQQRSDSSEYILYAAREQSRQLTCSGQPHAESQMKVCDFRLGFSMGLSGVDSLQPKGASFQGLIKVSRQYFLPSIKHSR